MKKLIIFAILVTSSLIFGQEGTNNSFNAPKNSFFVGVGSSSGGDDENDDMPWSIGVTFKPAMSKNVYGIDIAGEGTMLDSTYGGYNSLSQGTSYNFLTGQQLDNSGKLAGGLILGFRETEADCPDSYLGYQCYADEPPDYEYAFNGGLFLFYDATEKVSVGVRWTSESSQFVLGFSF